MALLRPGQTCWRAETADRAAFLIDSQDYFTAAYEALLRAKKQVILLGWGFDPRTRLAPDGGMGKSEPDEIGRVLLDIAQARHDLEVHLLIWRSALPISASQEFFPHKARQWFRGTRVRFHLDDMVPLGACHHQKLLVVDDQVAFVGGGDFAADRWDSTAHLDQDNRRKLADHADHPPRHEVMVMVDGPAAAALGDHARERWRNATGEVLPQPDRMADHAWPHFVPPMLEEVPVGVSRTSPAWRQASGVDEIRAMTFATIAGARRRIYLENQYMTSPLYAEALSARLVEPDGPEVVLVSTMQSPSWFDQLTMDRARALFVRRLRDADVFGRLFAYTPQTAGGTSIIVHAKTSIFDDDVVRVGSANMNNRSGGFDTELELTLEARTPAHRAAIARFRNTLIGHYLGRDAEAIARAAVTHQDLPRAIRALNAKSGRLRPIATRKLTRFEQLVATYHLGDPTRPADSMRPWKRRRELHGHIRSLAGGATPSALPSGGTSSKSTTSGK